MQDIEACSTIFVSGFDRKRCDKEDLYQFMEGKFGAIKNFK